VNKKKLIVAYASTYYYGHDLEKTMEKVLKPACFKNVLRKYELSELHNKISEIILQEIDNFLKVDFINF